jgi:hypothetical protein
MRLCAERGAAAVNAARAELGPRRFQRELVNDRLMLVDGAVDAVELLGREHVDRQAFLDLGDALLVLGFERFEGAHEVVESVGHVVAGGTRAGNHRAVATGLGLNHFRLVKFAHFVPLLWGGHRPTLLAVMLGASGHLRLDRG